MALDVAALREGFPSLKSGIAHFDGPGGTQTPAMVGEAVAATLTGPLSNRGRSVLSERNADDAVAAFRSAFADLLGVPAAGVVHGRSATALAYDFSRHLAKNWGPGDEIVVTRLDHDSNVRPWIQAAERAGATVRWLELNPATADLDLSAIDEVIGERTRLVAVTGASNLLGTRPDVAAIATRAHEVGALAYVDGVHRTAHDLVDISALGADFYTCSPYKFFGPHCGVLAASPDLLETITPDKLMPSTNVVPERFEFGTLPYELLAGATAAVDFLAGLGEGATRRARLAAAHHEISDHEMGLRRRVEQAVAGWGDAAMLHSVAADRTPTLFMTFPGRRSAEVSAFLSERDIQVPAGTFYAYETFAALGISHDDAGLRVGVAAYTDDADVDRLLTGIDDFLSP